MPPMMHRWLKRCSAPLPRAISHRKLAEPIPKTSTEKLSAGWGELLVVGSKLRFPNGPEQLAKCAAEDRHAQRDMQHYVVKMSRCKFEHLRCQQYSSGHRHPPRASVPDPRGKGKYNL